MTKQKSTNKTKSKTILFEKLDFIKGIRSSIKEGFNGVFSQGTEVIYTTKYQEDDFCIQIIEKNDQYFFGTIYKTTDLKEDMARLKNAKTKVEINTKEMELEKYTFFLIDFNENVLAYINNQSIENVMPIICNFIIDVDNFPFFLSGNLALNVKESIKKLKRINAVTVKFHEVGVVNHRTKFRNLLNCDSLDFCSVEVKFKPVDNNANFADDFMKSLTNYKSATVNGIDSENMPLLINATKLLFSRKARINLEDITRNNYDTIREILKKQIKIAINPATSLK